MRVSAQIEAARGEGAEEVRLIAVTKNRSVEEIRSLYDAGLRDFGENRVQELVEKIPILPSDIRWHMIGTLQKNKVKYLIDKVAMIQSVDSAELLEQIDKLAAKAGRVIDILLQVNTAREAQKHGFFEEDILSAVSLCGRCRGVRLRGLMMIAPNLPLNDELSAVFAKTKNIYGEVMKISADYDNICIDTLSMGMSNDFTSAIAHGANMVRIGRALFA